MKKLNLFLVAGFVFCASAVYSADTPAKTAQSPASSNATDEARREIIRRDQIDNTDVLAIQLDDSEVEDEEEINQLEGKNVFNLPQAPQKK